MMRKSELGRAPVCLGPAELAGPELRVANEIITDDGVVVMPDCFTSTAVKAFPQGQIDCQNYRT